MAEPRRRLFERLWVSSANPPLAKPCAASQRLTMQEEQGRARLFAPWAEAPLAYTCVALVAATLVWKTVGLGALPGWEEIFGGPGAQYPRARALTPAWQIGYIAMYGVFGALSTIAGLQITRRRADFASPAGPQIARGARIVGAFHVLLALHHMLWAATRGRWGHLSLEQFEAPWLYACGFVAALGAGWHGVQLLRTSATDTTRPIVRSKIAVDGVSVLTFLSVVVCFARNALGMDRDFAIERASWIAVFVCPVIWLLADFAWARLPPRAQTKQ